MDHCKILVDSPYILTWKWLTKLTFKTAADKNKMAQNLKFSNEPFPKRRN